MRDSFYEETSVCQNASSQKTIYYIYLSLSFVFIILSAVWIFVILYTVDFGKITEGSWFLNILWIILPLLATIALAILFLFLKNKHCLDFDYTFVSGSVRISKIIKEVKRRLICKFEASQIDKIGRVGSAEYNAISVQKNVRTIIATSNKIAADDRNFFYFLVSGIDENKKVLLILESTDIFISNVLKYANRYVLEKDFK